MKEFKDWMEKNHGKDWLSKFNVYEINIAEVAFQAGQRTLPAEVREVMEVAKKWTDERYKGFIGICSIFKG